MSEVFVRSFGITPLRALMDMTIGCLIGALIAYVEAAAAAGSGFFFLDFGGQR